MLCICIILVDPFRIDMAYTGISSFCFFLWPACHFHTLESLLRCKIHHLFIVPAVKDCCNKPKFHRNALLYLLIFLYAVQHHCEGTEQLLSVLFLPWSWCELSASAPFQIVQCVELSGHLQFSVVYRIVISLDTDIVLISVAS